MNKQYDEMKRKLYIKSEDDGEKYRGFDNLRFTIRFIRYQFKV